MSMRKWLPQAADHYKPILFAILAITLAAAWRAGGLRITITSESMMVADAPAQAFYALTRETFGSDEVTLLILQDQVTLLPLSVVVLVLALTIAMKRPRYAPKSEAKRS